MINVKIKDGLLVLVMLVAPIIARGDIHPGLINISNHKVYYGIRNISHMPKAMTVIILSPQNNLLVEAVVADTEARIAIYDTKSHQWHVISQYKKHQKWVVIPGELKLSLEKISKFTLSAVAFRQHLLASTSLLVDPKRLQLKQEIQEYRAHMQKKYVALEKKMEQFFESFPSKVCDRASKKILALSVKKTLWLGPGFWKVGTTLEQEQQRFDLVWARVQEIDHLLLMMQEFFSDPRLKSICSEIAFFKKARNKHIREIHKLYQECSVLNESAPEKIIGNLLNSCRELLTN